MLQDRLVQDLTAAGLFAEDGLVMELDVTGFRFRSGAVSFWFGVMAGGDTISADAEVLVAGRPGATFGASTSSLQGGMMTPSTDARLRNLTYDLSERLVRAFANTPISQGSASPAASAEEIPASESTGSVEDRLRELDRLYDRGLIDDDEYEASRERILRDL